MAVARALDGAPPVAALAAVLAVAGNCWPVYLGFRGGKGVATGLGAFLALIPWAVLAAAVVWGATTGASRYVSLGSVAACIALPVAAALLGYAPTAVGGRGRGGRHHRLASPREPPPAARRHRTPPRPAGGGLTSDE